MSLPRSLLRRMPVLGMLALPLAAGGSDPFAPGLRWVWPSPAVDPWIPCDVGFAARGGLVWVAAVGAEGRWSVLEAPGASPAGPRQPAFEHLAPQAPAASAMAVGGRSPGALFGLRQEPATTPDKRSVVVRHDPLGASAGAPFDPVWSVTLGFVSPGPARIDTDEEGRTVVAAVLDPGAAQVELTWIDGETGNVTASAVVPGAALNELQVSADGSRVVVAAGLDVYLFAADGTPIDQLVRSAATPAVALSRTGRALAVGGSAELEVWVQRPAGYRRVHRIVGTPEELALRAALSASGERLAVAWWDRTTGVHVRLETWDLAPLARRLEYSQLGPQGGLQNVPEALVVSADGRRVALGTWGLGGSEPELLLFDFDDETPVLAADLPGSVHDVDLDPSGTRLAVAHKDAHANQFSPSGAVRLYDTGERELALVVPPRSGGEVRCVARRPGAGSVLFLVGPRATTPAPLAGVGGGNLFLDPGAMRVFARSADASGRAEWRSAVPADGSWVGIPFSVQAAFRVAGSTELSGAVVDPLVLRP